MATVSTVISGGFAAQPGLALPLSMSVGTAAASVTSSGTSQQSSAAAPSSGWESKHWTVTANGGDVWVKFGANPTAAAGGDWLILDGQTRNFAVSGASEKIAIIDAS